MDDKFGSNRNIHAIPFALMQNFSPVWAVLSGVLVYLYIFSLQRPLELTFSAIFCFAHFFPIIKISFDMKWQHND